MDIYERLQEDHERQKELAEAIVETSGSSEERRDLWETFKTEAEAHANAEEQTFYAALIEVPEAQEQARHSISEHKEASDLIEQLSKLDMSSPGWLQKFKKLKEELEHHIDEEESDVFELGREHLDESTARRLAREFERRKESEAAETEAGA